MEYHGRWTGETRACRQIDPPLARALRAGGLLHYGQGKWYPGESLPRWGFSVYWRKDSKPIWNNPAIIAKLVPGDQADAETLARAKASLGEEQRAQAETLATGIAARLGIDPEYILPAYQSS